MSENRIVLKFDKAATGLAGNPYGKTVYEEQVKDKIDFDGVNIIKFPDEIIQIASSFVQGFFMEIVKRIGYEAINDHIIIEAVHDKVVINMMEDLMN